MPQCTSELIEKGKIYHEERKTASHITKCLKMKSGEKELGVYSSLKMLKTLMAPSAN